MPPDMQPKRFSSVVRSPATSLGHSAVSRQKPNAEPDQDDTPRSLSRWVRNVLRFAKHIGTYFALLVVAGAGLTLAGKVARMLGFSGNQIQLVRFGVLGLYVAAAVVMAGTKH